MPTKSKKESVSKTPSPKSDKKDDFAFGSIPTRMTKEERNAIISKALTPKSRPTPEYTLDETDYTPDKWVVVLTPKGYIYQEPVPRYWDYSTFVNILAAIPDKSIESYNKISFNAEICKTSFEVKGIECYIISVPFDNSRKENTYGDAFNIKNSTKKVGGNIVFAGGENGLNKKQASDVTSHIIKTLKNYEEIIEVC